MAAKKGPFKTHRYLNGFRDDGFTVIQAIDTAGAPCWNISHRNYSYDRTLPAASNNNPNEEYVGKIVRRGRFPLWLRGKPYFYIVGRSPTNQTRDSAVGQRAYNLGERLRPNSVRDQLPPV